ncbi:unnamed protein product [Amoebophrya sp. A25]|nr:unnamed protein product [Amoebophrya sp. A25]|eukprot:GSA25T00003559001.1
MTALSIQHLAKIGIVHERTVEAASAGTKGASSSSESSSSGDSNKKKNSKSENKSINGEDKNAKASNAKAAPKPKATSTPAVAVAAAPTGAPPSTIKTVGDLETKTDLLYMHDFKWTEIGEYADDHCHITAVAYEEIDVDASSGADPSSTPKRIIIKSLAFNTSIMHPQGGGQPTDLGTVNVRKEICDAGVGESGKYRFEINMVRHCKDNAGVVWHDVVQEKSPVSFASLKELEEALLSPTGTGRPVSMTIDMKARMLNARLHTAGHLIDVAVSKVGLKSWRPAKGYHFPDGPYVEYIFPMEEKDEFNKDKDGWRQRIEDACGETIKMHTAGATAPEASAAGSGGRGVSISVKAGVRHVECCGVETHCGGTHVDDVGKIGTISVGKIELKKDRARVKYKIAPC